MKFSRLDRPSIRKLQPGQSLGEHGITAERLANGDVRYSINIMVAGRRIHRVIGNESAGVTRYQAEQAIEKIRTEARIGRLGLAKASPTAAPTFEKVGLNYLARLQHENGKNLKPKRIHLRNHLIKEFGARRADTLSPLDIERYRRNRLAVGAAKATVNRELSTLNHLFVKAVEWGWIDRVPVRVKKQPEDNTRMIVLTNDQLARLKKAAVTGPDPDLWLFIEIACSTSMRHGEIVCARWEHIDFANRRIFVPKAKAGARQQPMTANLADTLRRERPMRLDQEGWIFPARYQRSRNGHITSFEHQFRAAVESAGLDTQLITPHVLRHTAITRLVQAGVDLITIMQISGHKSLRMVQRYAHVSAPHIDQAIAALDKTAN